MKISKICVVGAGVMGNQIVQLAAQSGYEVSVSDIGEEIVQRGINAIRGNMKKFFVDKGKMTQDEAELVLSRIKGTTDLKKAVTGAQLVIEAVSEDIKLKQELFKKLDEVCAPETILASNTSSLMITEIGSLTKRQDKVIGMHFWNPVLILKLVEVIRGNKTSDETYAVIQDLSVKFGKVVVTVKDSPGLVVGRLFAVLCNEAAKMLEEGIATVEDIDNGCVLGLGHAMGPFKTQDIVNGVGVTVKSLKTMQAAFGDCYAPTKLQEKMAAAGETGVQAGKGFYNYKK